MEQGQKSNVSDKIAHLATDASLSEESKNNIVAVQEQMKMMATLYKSTLNKGIDYGDIPGVDKPSLFKPGAEKIGTMFKLAPKYEIKSKDLENSHKEFEVKCSLHQRGTDLFFGDGVGFCSSMEKKYRYRSSTGEKSHRVTKEYWDAKNAKDYKTMKRLAKGCLTKKDTAGEWWFCKRVQEENPDITDVHNTILKMAKKRAFVDAILTISAVSDIFTQDVEDLHEYGYDKAEAEKKEDQKKPEGRENAVYPEVAGKDAEEVERMYNESYDKITAYDPDLSIAICKGEFAKKWTHLKPEKIEWILNSDPAFVKTVYKKHYPKVVSKDEAGFIVEFDDPSTSFKYIMKYKDKETIEVIKKGDQGIAARYDVSKDLKHCSCAAGVSNKKCKHLGYAESFLNQSPFENGNN